MGEEALVDDTDSGGAFIIKLADILYPVVSRRAVYIYTILIAIDIWIDILYTLIQRIV